LEKLKANYGVKVQWRSYELRPAGTVISPEYQERILSMRPQMEQMARERYGLEINVGPFGIDSRPALVGAKYAEAAGVGEAYHEAVYEAYWQNAQNIEDEAILKQIAVKSGLEERPFLDALQDETYQAQVNDDISQAFQYGLSGVPALVFANKYLVSGAQPYEVLVQVTEKVLEELAGTA
jgi:predicted DsbA family dithiol-disulfide isomerase